VGFRCLSDLSLNSIEPPVFISSDPKSVFHSLRVARSGYLRAGFSYCTFLSGRPSLCALSQPPPVVGFWSAAFLRSAKGRAVVVDPVFLMVGGFSPSRRKKVQ
jgi:hypothetical protein